MVVSQACDAIIAHTGSKVQEGAAAFVEEFEAKESKYVSKPVLAPFWPPWPPFFASIWQSFGMLLGQPRADN